MRGRQVVYKASPPLRSRPRGLDATDYFPTMRDEVIPQPSWVWSVIHGIWMVVNRKWKPCCY